MVKLCCIRENINDAPSIEDNYGTFREHRHDQAIYSLLWKKLESLDDYQWKVVSMLQETELEKVF